MKFSPLKLVERRKIKGFSQDELGQKLNLHIRTIQQWEYAQRVPNGTNLRALAEILGCSPEDFYEPITHTRPVNADASSLARLAPMPPSKAKHFRIAKQKLKAARDVLVSAHESGLAADDQTEKLKIAQVALARVQRDILAAMDELDQMEG